jgi:hypothetical protein
VAPAPTEDDPEPVAPKDIEITRFRTARIDMLPAGERIYVLGRRVGSTGGGDNAHIEMVEAIVAAEVSYTAPALTPEQSKKNLSWNDGTWEMHGARPWLDRYEIKVPPDRLVPIAMPGARDALAAKMIVAVEGERTTEPKAKGPIGLNPSKIAVLAPQVSIAEYETILAPPAAPAPSARAPARTSR